MPDKLQLSPEEVRAMGEAAVDWVAEYYAGLNARPVATPATSAALRAPAERASAADGADFASLLETVNGPIAGFTRHNAHPRAFGYVGFAGDAGDCRGGLLASTIAANVTGFRSAAAPTGAGTRHHQLAQGDAGLSARSGRPAGERRLHGQFRRPGRRPQRQSARRTWCATGWPRPAGACASYVSEEGHSPISKAAGMLGLGEDNVRSVKTDARLRIDLDDLESLVRQDLAAGHLPFCVAANAGTTATARSTAGRGGRRGAPLQSLAARGRRLWRLRGPGALGAHFFAGIERADSVALDPHKWLYLPVGCGCVLYKDPAAARAAFSTTPNTPARSAGTR